MWNIDSLCLEATLVWLITNNSNTSSTNTSSWFMFILLFIWLSSTFSWCWFQGFDLWSLMVGFEVLNEIINVVSNFITQSTYFLFLVLKILGSFNIFVAGSYVTLFVSWSHFRKLGQCISMHFLTCCDVFYHDFETFVVFLTILSFLNLRLNFDKEIKKIHHFWIEFRLH